MEGGREELREHGHSEGGGEVGVVGGELVVFDEVVFDGVLREGEGGREGR
jgi:hypothetical protein